MDDLLTSYISLMLQTMNRQKNVPASAAKPGGVTSPPKQEKAPSTAVPIKPKAAVSKTGSARPKLGAGRMGVSGAAKKK